MTLPKSARVRAWRNVVVSAINAALEQGVFTLEPGPVDERVYAFEIAGLPAVAQCRDVGWDEVSVHAAVNPPPGKEHAVGAIGGRFYTGDVFAHAYLERLKGRYIQTSCGIGTFGCRQRLKPLLAAARVEPAGYADTGTFML